MNLPNGFGKVNPFVVMEYFSNGIAGIQKMFSILSPHSSRSISVVLSSRCSCRFFSKAFLEMETAIAPGKSRQMDSELIQIEMHNKRNWVLHRERMIRTGWAGKSVGSGEKRVGKWSFCWLNVSTGTKLASQLIVIRVEQLDETSSPFLECSQSRMKLRVYISIH